MRRVSAGEKALAYLWADIERNSSDVEDFEQAVDRGRQEDGAAHTGSFLDGFHLPGAPEFERLAEEEWAHWRAATRTRWKSWLSDRKRAGQA